MNGALYDMVAPSKLFANPTGEWNHYLIEINYNDNVGNVDLNGNRAISFPLEGPEWDALINNSKFRDWKGFANTKTGPIAFQDHGTTRGQTQHHHYYTHALLDNLAGLATWNCGDVVLGDQTAGTVMLLIKGR